jgi:L-fuconolactonase
MSASGAQSRPMVPPIRQDWLDRHQEQILEPDLPIVDPHHHLNGHPGTRWSVKDSHPRERRSEDVRRRWSCSARITRRPHTTGAVRAGVALHFKPDFHALPVSCFRDPARGVGAVHADGDRRLSGKPGSLHWSLPEDAS